MAAVERIAKWGSGGGIKEKKLKKKKWGRKRWSNFGQGILDRIGACDAGGCWFEVDGAVRQLLGRVRVSAWLVGRAGSWCTGWLGAFPIEDAPMRATTSAFFCKHREKLCMSNFKRRGRKWTKIHCNLPKAK
jgi:hypothetical protein